jgi:hypothetical protein
MSEEKKAMWTLEPWDYVGQDITNGGNKQIAMCNSCGSGDAYEPSVAEGYENARRIVACVNKLAGHADLDAVEVVPKGTMEENKRLREALLGLYDPLVKCEAVEDWDFRLSAARRALE